MGPWTEHFDAASGKPYWHNTDTRETTWEKPDSLPMRDETEAVDTVNLQTDIYEEAHTYFRLRKNLDSEIFNNPNK